MKMILAIYLVLAAATTTVIADNVIDDGENPQFLYVLNATSGSFDGETLTLTGVPSVIYFSDRPYRIAGHMSLEEFVENWNKGSDIFEADPPNATLSILDAKEVENAVVELSNPEIKGNVLDIDILLLSGSIEPEFSVCGLYIDDTYGQIYEHPRRKVMLR
jgi:hypothetical protein